MKKKIFSTLTLSLLFLGLISQASPVRLSGEKETESETRQLASFTNITSNGSVDIILKHGSVQEVKVVADEGLVKKVRTEVNGNTLTVSNPGQFWNVKVLRVYITLPVVKEIKLTGSGDFETEGTFPCNDLVFNVRGSGDIQLNLNAVNLKGSISGSGDAEINGVTGILDITLSGSGDIEAKGLRLSKLLLQVSGSGDAELEGVAENVTIGHFSSGDISLSRLKAQNGDIEQRGSGDCSIFVTDELNISNSGSGDVYVYGNPVKRRGSSHGSGDIYYK